MGDKRDIRKIITNTNAKKALHVEVYNNFEELEAIQQVWDNFVESVGAEIFLTYDWCRIWWKYYGKNRDLRVFVFRSDNGLVGIIPMFVEKIWLGPIFIRAAKIVGSDFTISHFSLPIHSKHIGDVILSFSKLLSQDKWDIIHIGPIAGLYNHYDKLKHALQQSLGRSCCVVAKVAGVQTYFKLTNTWEEYLAGLKKKERQLIRSSYRKVDKDNLILNAGFASADNCISKFESFVLTHQSQWQNMGKAGHFEDWPDSLEFHRETASIQLRNNRLRLLEIRLSDDCFAYQYSYKFGQTYFELLMGRSLSKDSAHIDLGRLVFAEQAKKAISEGVNCVDSMRGEYEYKLRLGGKLFPLRSMYIFQKKSFALSRVFLFRILSRFLDLCYYRIWYCRIAPKLPIKRQPLWRIWIKSSAFAS